MPTFHLRRAHKVPEFWGRQYQKYSDTLEFKLIEKHLDIRTAIQKTANAEFALKISKTISDKKDIEMEKLKMRVKELEAIQVKDAA